jgi:hypothetical protein
MPMLNFNVLSNARYIHFELVMFPETPKGAGSRIILQISRFEITENALVQSLDYVNMGL